MPVPDWQLEQLKQTVSALAAHACPTYLPAGHVEQVRHTASAKYGHESVMYVLAGQTVRDLHTVLLVVLHACA